MEKLTLTAYYDNGTSVASIDLSGNVIYGTDWQNVPYNQSVIETLDGGRKIYGNVTTKITTDILINGVSYAEGLAFKNFIKNSLIYRARVLGINVNGHQIDLGKGIGTSIAFADGAHLLNENSEGMADRHPPGDYNINFSIIF